MRVSLKATLVKRFSIWGLEISKMGKMFPLVIFSMLVMLSAGKCATLMKVKVTKGQEFTAQNY